MRQIPTALAALAGALLACGPLQAAQTDADRPIPRPGESEKAGDPGVNWNEQYKNGASLLKAKDPAKGLKLLAEVAEKAPDAEPARLQAAMALMLFHANRIDLYQTRKYGEQALASPALDAQQRIKVLRDMRDLFCLPPRMNFQYHHYYYNLCSEREYAQMKNEYPAYLRQILGLDPGDTTSLIDLGYHEILNGNPDKGMAELQTALAGRKLTPEQIGNVYVGLAEGAFVKGDRAGAVAFLETLDAMNLNTRSRQGACPAEFAKAALSRLKGTRQDSLELPVYLDCRAFPAPQEARYEQAFAPLRSVRLTLGAGLKAEDARVGLLKNKLARYGIVCGESGAFSVEIDTGKLQAPEKPEGYALAVSRDGALIQGRDRQGTLWGIVTLIQLMDPASSQIRLCTIRDWPDVANRGHAGVHAEILEFDLFAKMNWVLTNNGRWTEQQRYTPLRWFVDLDIAREFADFGLQYYCSFRFETMHPMVPISAERTYDMHVELLSRFAKAGAHAAWMYDDSRYPLHPQDVAVNRNGAGQDAAYITKVYRAVKAKYPDFKMIFCPPFYWGPYYSSSFKEYRKKAGGDERDAYNKSIRDHLDPEIDVFWAGNRMVSYSKTSQDVEWAAQALGRKPFVWQNRACPHWECSYIADNMPGWTEWHYDGFFQDVAGYMMNSHAPKRCAAIATCADALWNLNAYSATGSVRRAVGMLYGEKMYDILEPGARALGSLDKYWDSTKFVLTPEFVADLPEIERQIQIARDSYEKAVAYNRTAMTRYPGEYVQFLQEFERLIQRAKAESAAKARFDANPGK